MVSAVSDPLSVRQRQQSAPTAASSSAAPTPGSSKAKGKGRGVAVPKWRLESYRRWAQVGQGQHQVAAAQTGAQALKQAKGQLEGLQRQINSALQGKSSSDGGQMSASRDRLSQQSVSYRGQTLVDRQFNLVGRHSQAAPRQFALKGTDLTASKPRDEQLNIQLGKERAQIDLPAGADREALARILNDGLSAIGLGARLGRDGQVMLMLNEQQAAMLDGGLWMSGQGARLPAGQAVPVKTQEVLPWQDPREWQFDNNAQLRQSQAKLLKTLNKVDAQLAQLEAVQQTINHRLAKVNRASQASAEVMEKASQELQQAMDRSPFRTQLSTMLAQANLSRSQVTELLQQM
ncbi:hypothetical protein [Ferrimonas pelagia]|uniref:Flagellin n=1 Tax=Ferrimonas pelagia TaxID=1177826 RepID=A0ABP9EX00_9GAMM